MKITVRKEQLLETAALFILEIIMTTQGYSAG
jgi:hypothetical protein